MREHHIEVRRTARYLTLGQERGAAEVWIACHGYAQLARSFLPAFAPIADGTRLVVAPEALNRYYLESAPGVHGPDARVGGTWMTREDRTADVGDYVAYLDALAERVAGHAATVVAFGFSQGAATVSRWAALGSARIDHVVLWGAGVAHDLPLHAGAFRGATLTLAVGSSDRYMDDARVAAEQQRLHDAGLEHALLRYRGGHRVGEDALLRLAGRIRSREGGRR